MNRQPVNRTQTPVAANVSAAHTRYALVWARDAECSTHTDQGVESVAAVAARVANLIADLERRFQGTTVVLVSHGDTLQIGQTVFAGVPPETHRSLPHLNNCEVRPLMPAASSALVMRPAAAATAIATSPRAPASAWAPPAAVTWSLGGTPVLVRPYAAGDGPALREAISASLAHLQP